MWYLGIEASLERCICPECTGDLLNTRITALDRDSAIVLFGSIKTEAELPSCEVPSPAGPRQAENQRLGNKPLTYARN